MMAEHHEQAAFESLTERELEVLHLMARRLSNREIAAQLVIELETARWYSKQIYSKLGVHSRAEAIARAAELGLGMGADPDATDDAGQPLVALAHNLPAQTTPFIGRARELAELGQLLSDSDVRLLTILGPGGMGKTRLALELADFVLRRMGEPPLQKQSFRDGLYFVPLAALDSPDNLVSTIAEAIGFQLFGASNPQRQLLEYLRSKALLLILDNFEHLLAGAGLVADILAAAPGVKIIVTTRERLNLLEETLFRIEGLQFPQRQPQQDVFEHDAVQFFIQSAQRTLPTFELADADLDAVAQICRLVGGMPLGILLAAAWVEMLPLSEIAAEIDQSLDFLATDMRNLPQRLRSIRAVFERSWSLLSDDERAVFKKLAVFRGGFTREAAREVAAASLHDLTALVNKSLVQPDPSGRYDVHELLRQYAEEKLNETPGEHDQIRDLHCAYYAEFMRQHEDDLWIGSEREQDVLHEIENVRAAWRRAVAAERFADIHKILLGLWMLYEYQGWWLEAAQNFAWAAGQLREDHPAGAKGIAFGLMLCAQSQRFRRIGRIEEGRQLILDGQAILRDLDAREEIALTNIWLLSHGSRYSPEIIEDYDEMSQLLHESLETFEALDHPRGQSWTWLTLGNLARDHDEHEQARIYYQKGLAIARQFDAARDIGWAYHGLAGVALRAGAYEETKQYLLDFRAFGKDADLRLSWHLNQEAEVEFHLKNYLAARQSLCESLEIHADKTYMAFSTLDVLLWFARIQIAEGQSVAALELLALIQAHPESLEETQAAAAQLLSDLESQLPSAHFDAAVERGVGAELPAVVEQLLAACED